ncbi:MAG: DUF2125 domain-containing protein [Acetobacteraceae bacterium]|nr:DUF2125 domain-containing protein [Acetobacteraceae bacterium]
MIGLSGLSVSARAADVTAEQAQDVAKQLREWIGGQLGGGLPIPSDIFGMTPAGAQMRLVVPLSLPVLAMQGGDTKATDALISAALRPLGGTRWAIEDLRMPAVISLTPDAAAPFGGPGANSGRGARPAPSGRPGAEPTAPGMEIRIRSQSATGVYDTSLKTESRLEATAQGLAIRSSGLGDANQRMEVTVDRYVGLMQLRPTTAGGVDTISEWTMEGYNSRITDPAVGEVKLGIRRVSMRGEIAGLMTGQVTTLLQNAMQWGLAAAMQPGYGMTNDPLGDAGRTKLKVVVAALKGLLVGMTVTQAVEGVQAEMLGVGGGADKVLLGFGGSAPAGKFGAYLDIEVDGLKAPFLPPSYASLLPHSVSLRPTVGNIDVAALTALVEEAAQPKANLDAVGDKLFGLVTGNGVTVGLERLSIDLGTTKLSANGSVTASRPMTAKGQVEIVVTGFDALIERIQKIPEVMEIIPALVLVRGLGRSEGDKLVWRLALTEDQKIMVNGVDLRKLGGR